MSRDPVWKVGAVLVHPDRRQCSMGYNGLVKGMPETPENWGKPRKLMLVRHAERNAISWAPFYKPGSELFVPLRPCAYCLGDAVNNGISRVAWFRDPANEANPDYYGPEWDMFASMVETAEYDLDDKTTAILALYGLDGTMKYPKEAEGCTT